MYTGVLGITLFVVAIGLISVGLLFDLRQLVGVGAVLMLPTLLVMFVAGVMGRAHGMEKMTKRRRRR